MNDLDVSLSRALVAIIIQELDKQIKDKKFHSRRDFAIKNLNRSDAFATLYRLTYGVPNKDQIPKLDIDLADQLASALGFQLFELVVLAQAMIKSNTFPYGEIANTKPIKNKITKA